MRRLHEHQHERPLHLIGVIICLMGLIALAFSAVLHDVPLSHGQSLFKLLKITDGDLDKLYGYHQYELIACIILSGLIIDLIGPRTVLVMALAITVLSNYFFMQGSCPVLIDCRLIINVTHIFILTATLTLGTHWLPRRHFSLFVGLWSCILACVPLLIRPYLQSINTLTEFQSVFNKIDIFGLIAIAGILLVAPFTDKTRHQHTIAGLFAALRYYKVWLIALVGMIGWICNTVVLSFGSIYIIKHFNLTTAMAFELIRVATYSFAIGAVVMGILSDMVQRRGSIIAVSYCLAAVAFCVLVFTPNLSLNAATGALFAVTFLLSSIIVCYRKANDYCTIGNSGVTMGFVLSFSLVGSRLLASTMSYYLRKYAVTNLPADMVSAQLPLIIVPALLLVGAVIAGMLVKPVMDRPKVSVPVIKGFAK